MSAFRSRRLWRVVATAAAVLFVAISAPAARQNSKNVHQLSVSVERMLRGSAQARALHPDKILLLDGVNNELFIGGICDAGLEVMGLSDVYLAPGSERRIAARAGVCDPADFTLPGETAAWLQGREQIAVYKVGGPRLQNITRFYAPERSGLAGKRLRINVAAQTSAAFLGAGWYPPDGELRWMSGRAAIEIPAGFRNSRRLALLGGCGEEQLRSGPLTLKAWAGKNLLGEIRITTVRPFEHEFAIAAAEEITLEVDRTFRPAGETRELGVALRSVEIR